MSKNISEFCSLTDVTDEPIEYSRNSKFYNCHMCAERPESLCRSQFSMSKSFQVLKRIVHQGRNILAPALGTGSIKFRTVLLNF